MKAHIRHTKIIEILLKYGVPMDSDFVRLYVFDINSNSAPLRTVQRDLNRLAKAGILNRVGNARSTKYVVSKEMYEEIVSLYRAYDLERSEWAKHRISEIAPRFRFRHKSTALSWLIQQTLINAE